MNLTPENAAVVLDSTADFPDAQIRFPNMRVVPLYGNVFTILIEGVAATGNGLYSFGRT